MAERDWLRPQVPTEADETAWQGRRESLFALRPLTLGELLDRTFSLYRARFWLFAAIAMVVATLHVVNQLISFSALHTVAGRLAAAHTPTTPLAALTSFQGLRTITASSYALGLLILLCTALTHAATAFALGEVYQQRPITAQGALQRVFPRWLRWVGIALWQALCLAVVPLLLFTLALVAIAFGARGGNGGLSGLGVFLVAVALLGGLPVGVMLYLRNSLAIPASVTEGLALRPALRRSKALAAGAKGRMFVILLIAVCLLEVVGILQSPIGFLLLMAPNQQHYLAEAVSLVLSFVGYTVAAPVALIGLTLVYFDQRVRMEAFDLEVLLADAHHGRSAPLDDGLSR